MRFSKQFLVGSRYGRRRPNPYKSLKLNPTRSPNGPKLAIVAGAPISHRKVQNLNCRSPSDCEIYLTNYQACNSRSHPRNQIDSKHTLECQGSPCGPLLICMFGLDRAPQPSATLSFFCIPCRRLFFFFRLCLSVTAGKDLGTPAPPSATSSNPYGANYASGEEHKNGKY